MAVLFNIINPQQQKTWNPSLAMHSRDDIRWRGKRGKGKKIDVFPLPRQMQLHTRRSLSFSLSLSLFLPRNQSRQFIFTVLLLHPGHQFGAALRVHRLQPVQPGVDHVPAVGHHVQDHPKVPRPLRAGQWRQESAGDDQVCSTMRPINLHSLRLYLPCRPSACQVTTPCLEIDYYNQKLFQESERLETTNNSYLCAVASPSKARPRPVDKAERHVDPWGRSISNTHTLTSGDDDRPAVTQRDPTRNCSCSLLLSPTSEVEEGSLERCPFFPL